MSYVQGTQVRLVADFTDAETHAPKDPLEVILTVEAPDGTLAGYTLSDNEVISDVETGRFYYVLDTSSAAGEWLYQFESTGDEAVVGRKQITVRRRLETPVEEPAP